jgi:hypothetical protein
MPCGTDRSDPVQMLKITPVLPGAITEKELVRLRRTTIAARPTSTLLAIFATCSGDSRIVVMLFIFFLRVSAGPEVRHINRGEVSARWTGELPEEITFQPPLKGSQQKIDPGDCSGNENDLGKRHPGCG